MYWYQSQIDGIYYSDTDYDFDELYCETCGDSDWPIGYAETFQEAWELLLPYCNVVDSGGYYMSHILSELCAAYDVGINVKDVDDDDYKDSRMSDYEVVRAVNKITEKNYAIWEFHIVYENDEDEDFVDHCVAQSEKEVEELNACEGCRIERIKKVM